jgi:hypothetical protein
LYLYGIKIQTNIKQNLVKKYARKLQFFQKNFFNFFFFFELGRTRPNHFDSRGSLHCKIVENKDEEEERGGGGEADLRWLLWWLTVLVAMVN